MADYSAAQITLGGTLPRRLVPRLCKVICETGLAPEWGDAPLRPTSAEELLAARQSRGGEQVLWLCDDQARYGEFEDLEAFLIKHQIPFDRHSEGRHDDCPALVTYRPASGRRHWLATPQGQPLVPAEPLWELLGELRQAQRRNSRRRNQKQPTFQQLLARLAELLPAPASPLPSFEIGKSLGLRTRLAA